MDRNSDRWEEREGGKEETTEGEGDNSERGRGGSDRGGEGRYSAVAADDEGMEGGPEGRSRALDEGEEEEVREGLGVEEEALAEGERVRRLLGCCEERVEAQHSTPLASHPPLLQSLRSLTTSSPSAPPPPGAVRS